MLTFNVRTGFALFCIGYAIASMVRGVGAVGVPIAIAFVTMLTFVPGFGKMAKGASASAGSRLSKAAGSSAKKAGEYPWLFFGSISILGAIAILAYVAISGNRSELMVSTAVLLVALSAIAGITHFDKWGAIGGFLFVEHGKETFVAVSGILFLSSLYFEWGNRGNTFLFMTGTQWLLAAVFAASLVTISDSWGLVKQKALACLAWLWQIATFQKGRVKACFLYAVVLMLYGYFTNQTRPDDLGKLLATAGVALFVLGVVLAAKDEKK